MLIHMATIKLVKLEIIHLIFKFCVLPPLDVQIWVCLLLFSQIQSFHVDASSRNEKKDSVEDLLKLLDHWQVKILP